MNGTPPRWLKTLELWNFQSHEHTVLEFDPGVNIIRGTNDCGKTTVFRAVRLLAYNRPTRGVDEELIRDGASSCIVKGTMSDGSWVLREKGKDVNRYVVNSPLIRGGQIELNGFGVSVPVEVSLALGFGPLTIAKSEGMELNISNQGEGAFMLSETDPEIARWMYALTSLDDIRAAIDDLSLDHKRSVQSVRMHEERVEEVGRQLAAFEGLDERSVELGEIETAIARVTSETETRDALQRLLDDMIRLRNQAVPVKERAQRNAKVLAVLTNEGLSDLERRIVDVAELGEISRKLDQIQPQQAALARRVAVNLKIAKVSLDGFDERIAEVMVLSELSDRITKAEAAYSRAAQKLELSRRRALETAEAYQAIVAEVFSDAEGRNVCPMCQTEIDGDRIEHILEGHPDA